MAVYVYIPDDPNSEAHVVITRKRIENAFVMLPKFVRGISYTRVHDNYLRADDPPAKFYRIDHKTEGCYELKKL